MLAGRISINFESSHSVGWVCWICWVSLLLREVRFSSGTPVFPSWLKTNTSKFQFDLEWQSYVPDTKFLTYTRDNTTAQCTSFRRFPSTNADSRRLPKKFRRLPKLSEDCQRCPKATEDFRGEIRKFSKSRLNWLFLCVFHFSFSWKTLQIITGIFSGNSKHK